MVFASVCLPVSHCRAVSHVLVCGGSLTYTLIQIGRSTCVESAKVNASMLVGPSAEQRSYHQRRAELLRGMSQLSSRVVGVQLSGLVSYNDECNSEMDFLLIGF